MKERTIQHCQTCGKPKPLKPEYFDFRNVDKQEFHGECRVCRRIAREKAAGKEQPSQDLIPAEDKYIEHEKKLLAVERQRLAADRWLIAQAGMSEKCLRGVEKVMSLDITGSAVPHAAEMVEAFMTNFGGPMGVAGQLAALYWDPDTKQSERIRIMEMIQRAVLKNTEMGGAKKPVDLLNDEDIQKELTLLTIDEQKVA
jgi:hypothetical protein